MNTIYEIKRILSTLPHIDAQGVHHLYLLAGVIHPSRHKQTAYEKLLFAVSCIEERNAAELLEAANIIIKRQVKENMQRIRAEIKAEKKGGAKG